MAKDSISTVPVTAIRTEPRFDGLVEWSSSVVGDLEVGARDLIFKDWVIPFENIQDAVLNKEVFFWRKVVTLAVNSESCKYVFTIRESTVNEEIFPFPVRITRRKSPMGKAVLIAAALGIANIVWGLLSYYL